MNFDAQTPRPPKIIKPYVRAFCRKVLGTSSPVEPVFVRHRPAYAEQNMCFPAVAARVAAQGGKMVFGWAIFERPKVLIEAIFHAVWQTPGGDLLDISPLPVLFESILFLPDARRVYQGVQIDSIRQPLTQDKDIDRLLFLFREKFRMENAGNLKPYTGKFEIPPALGKVIEEITRLDARISRRHER
jgi:hypothetical protein